MDEAKSELFKTSFRNGKEGLFKAMSHAEQACKENGVADENIYLVNLCLEELVTNALKYGSAGRKHIEFSITIGQQDSGLLVQIIDNAKPFNPLRDAPVPDLDSDIEHRKLGGLGIHLIKTMTRSMQYDYINNCNIVLINI